jgi:hypothetical protein
VTGVQTCALPISVFWSDPEDARTKIGARLSEAAALEQALPHRIVEVLQRRETGSVSSRVVADPA